MPDWLIPLIVVDLIVTVAVVLVIVRRRRERVGGGGTPGAGSLFSGFREMAAFATDRHERIGEYVRANWSGIPEQLPQVLGLLLNELEREALTRGVSLDRDLLKTLVVTSLRHHHVGRGSEVQKALERVA